MSKHTPAPWTFDGEYVEALDCDVPESICTMAEIHERDFRGKRRKANALLIAASPDLLDALRPMTQGTYWLTSEHIEAARAAIAKAEGKTS